jgi:hypothetical protein
MLPQSETIDVSRPKAPSLIPGRHVKEGILLIPEKLYFTLKFDGFPIWILLLNRAMVQEVNFLDWAGPGALSAAMSSQGYNVSLFNAAISYIGLSKVQFGKPSRTASVWLVSGPTSFLVSYQECPSQPTLLLLSDHNPSKQVVQQGPFTWIQLRHLLFGGSTLFTALVGTNIPTFAPVKTPIRQNLGHVLDHGVLPIPLQRPLSEVLKMSDRLHPGLGYTQV